MFTQTLSDLTLDRSKVRSDKLLCVNTALAVIFSVYLSGLPIRFSVFTQTLSDLTLDRSKVRSDKLLCVNMPLVG